MAKVNIKISVSAFRNLCDFLEEHELQIANDDEDYNRLYKIFFELNGTGPSCSPRERIGKNSNKNTCNHVWIPDDLTKTYECSQCKIIKSFDELHG